MPSETVDQLLAQTLDAAAGGQASALGLYGPRGAGKTWWVDRAADQAARRTMTVMRARASNRERELTFGALAGLLAPWRDRIDDSAWAPLRHVVTFDHRPVDGLDVKLTTFHFLCALAEQQPVCVILDDLQWFDAATLEVRVGLPAAALQFALRHRAVTSVVVGARSREEVEADIADARVAIPEALWDELDEL